MKNVVAIASKKKTQVIKAPDSPCVYHWARLLALLRFSVIEHGGIGQRFGCLLGATVTKLVTVWALRSPTWAPFECSNRELLALLPSCDTVDRVQGMRIL